MVENPSAFSMGLTARSVHGMFRPVIANKAMMRDDSRRNFADQARSRVIPGAFSYGRGRWGAERLAGPARFPGLSTRRSPATKMTVVGRVHKGTSTMPTALQHAATIPPMPVVGRIFSRYGRENLEAFITAAIDLMDTLDGDPDFGPDGDELDGTGAEDDFFPQGNVAAAPGRPLSDPGEDDDPSGQCDEDGINTYFMGRWNEGPGCTISDPCGDEEGI